MPIWISHRGFSKGYDENTLLSFEAACEMGFQWLETDLHTTRDKHIVLCHDSVLTHISSSNGIIAQMTRTELEQIQLKRGGTLLFLDKFMRVFAQQNWIFDIKPHTAKETIKLLKLLLQKNKKLLNKIIFLFWDSELQSDFLNDFPKANCFPREKECYQAGLAVLFGLPLFGGIKENKIYSLTPRFLGFPMLNQRIVKIFHNRGAQVLGYLPETDQETLQCVNSGVDYILTNNHLKNF
ncbi:MAG: hypothetical protein GY694_18660 [Gammaproteobacteria bacterium]|nr:hypothetical protein [Gammaproteobacteria bacterium]